MATATSNAIQSRRSVRSYLRNCWYVAAWADELAHSEKLSRKILDEEVLLLRDAEGRPAALSNRCPHRFAPLDRGQFNGAEIQCPYHGLRFATDGRCVRNPHGDGAIAPGTQLRAYPLIERWGQLWIWMGDLTRAAPEKIPDFSCHTDPDRRLVKGVITMSAYYELVSDNLMDLSHVRYLHGTTLASPPGSKEVHEVKRVGPDVHSNLWVTGGNAPPAWDKMFDDYGMPVDHWLDMRWTAPSLLLLDVGVTKPNEAREAGIGVLFSHNLTPETDNTTHYFWGCTRTYKKSVEAIDEIWKMSIDIAFLNEDAPMVLAQQEVLGDRDLLEARPVILSPDKAAIQCRRILQRLIRDEQAGSTTAADCAKVAG